MFTHLPLIAACSAVAQAWHLRHMDNLVTFGDSYTDESRLDYFGRHNGQAPPAGELMPPSNHTSGGGYAWGRVVANTSGAKYYNYAVAGAMCANNITSHWFDPIHATMPSVMDYEVPAFEADLAFPKLYPDRYANNTMYAVWIGTNDLGYDGFLTDRNVAGTSLTTFIDCVFSIFDRVYKTGGRHFMIMNEVPLEKTPMYTSTGNGGTGDNQYWQNKTLYNTTETQYKMLEYTHSVNRMFEQGAPFHLLVEKRWPQASFSIFDVHSLFLDIIAAPSDYLTQPANVTWSWRACNPKTGCQESSLPLSSFLWYDELHPSARADEIVAAEFVKVVKGTSKYGKIYYS